MTKARYLRCVVIAATIISLPGRMVAQQTSVTSGIMSVRPGSELEEYLRYLQTTGAAKPTLSSIRELSIAQSIAQEPISANPWGARFQPKTSAGKLFEWTAHPLSLRTSLNSGFPFGGNDGAVWVGRGLTVAADAGGIVRSGPVILELN